MLLSSFSYTDIDYNSAVLELYLILVLCLGEKTPNISEKLMHYFFRYQYKQVTYLLHLTYPVVRDYLVMHTCSKVSSRPLLGALLFY